MFVFLKSIHLRFHIWSLKRNKTKNIWHNERIKGLYWVLSVQHLMEKQAKLLGACGGKQPLQSGPWILEWGEKSDYILQLCLVSEIRKGGKSQLADDHDLCVPLEHLTTPCLWVLCWNGACGLNEEGTQKYRVSEWGGDRLTWGMADPRPRLTSPHLSHEGHMPACSSCCRALYGPLCHTKCLKPDFWQLQSSGSGGGGQAVTSNLTRLIRAAKFSYFCSFWSCHCWCPGSAALFGGISGCNTLCNNKSLFAC